MLHTALIGLAFILATNALIFAGYFAMRALAAHAADADTRDLAGSVIFRVAALHGLILALVFAQQMTGYAQLEDETVFEATAVANIYNDMARYDPALAGPVQSGLISYVDIVLSGEWAPARGKDLLVPEAWDAWNQVYLNVLDLEPATPRQTSLRTHMLADIQTIARIRDLRADHHRDTLSSIFWFAAISGVLLVSAAYFSYTPSIYNLGLISVFGTYTGLVIFLIFAFSDPFLPPGNVKPYALIDLQTRLPAPGADAPGLVPLDS